MFPDLGCCDACGGFLGIDCGCLDCGGCGLDACGICGGCDLDICGVCGGCDLSCDICAPLEAVFGLCSCDLGALCGYVESVFFSFGKWSEMVNCVRGCGEALGTMCEFLGDILGACGEFGEVLGAC